jgi:hypothetical protein
MITCGAGVVGTPVTPTFEVAATEVTSTIVVVLCLSMVVLCLSSLSELRVERLIRAEVIVAAPMMSAAIIGPILVRLHQLAVRDGVTT